MAKKKKGRQTDEKDAFQDSKLRGFVASFLTIVGFVITLLAWKDDEYAMYYAKQGLMVFIVAVVAGIVSAMVGWIYVIGPIIQGVLWLIVFVLWLISWIYALSGDKKPIPLFGNIATKWKF